MTDKLTDRQFWIDYWENKADLIQFVTTKNFFKPLFEKILADQSIRNSLEIGGFPGYFSIYLKKYFQIEPTLLDYVIHHNIVVDLLEHNKMSVGDLNLIEADLFANHLKGNFDLTISYGFIEHFLDTKDIIQRHINFTKPGGTLFIIVPNFQGVNGWVNKKYNIESFNKHYLECMDRKNLFYVAKSCHLVDIQTFYYGKFSIWLENISTKSLLFKFVFKLVWFLGKTITTIIPVNSKLLSPYTVLIAKKSIDH